MYSNARIWVRGNGQFSEEIEIMVGGYRALAQGQTVFLFLEGLLGLDTLGDLDLALQIAREDETLGPVRIAGVR